MCWILHRFDVAYDFSAFTHFNHSSRPIPTIQYKYLCIYTVYYTAEVETGSGRSGPRVAKMYGLKSDRK